MKAPWEHEHHSFTGPGVAISCKVAYDRERECYLAIGSEGHRGTGDTAHSAALNCFKAWMTNDAGWFEPTEETP